MRLLLLIMLLAASSGCSMLRSRYAMDDPVYARKYAQGASKQNIPGKIKQAIDARHTKYLDGWLMSGGVQVNPRSGKTFGAIDVGRELYLTNYFTSRLSLSGIAGNDSASVGGDVGFRLQTPTRLAPFIGVGGSAGILVQDAVPLIIDVVQDSDDEIGSTTDDSSNTIGGLATIYPEIGAHFWINGHVRLTAFGRFLVTSEGRDFDDWLVGAQIAIFGR